jgi:hypothetical protein
MMRIPAATRPTPMSSLAVGSVRIELEQGDTPEKKKEEGIIQKTM